jgi:hypothetical protein
MSQKSNLPLKDESFGPALGISNVRLSSELRGPLYNGSVIRKDSLINKKNSFK